MALLLIGDFTCISSALTEFKLQGESVESLYRKYRPLTFESVVGQQHIVSTLSRAVDEGRISHAYLFCGPRGTGKTTMARILAKALLCQGAEAARATGASGCQPDGTCPECEAIATGTHPDVYELDAASRTGVENVREEIINSVNFAPVRGAYKVYIIDEVHMLTTAAFNALLKTLEEPPAHVVFVLCTTDPQKLLDTILSRCQRFDFHRISNEDIASRLEYVCNEENFEFDKQALSLVARHAAGGMRDALSTLEQLSVFGNGSVRIADAQALLGEISSDVLSEFTKKIATRDTAALFSLIRQQIEKGNDLLEVTRDLISHVRDVYTAAIAGENLDLFDVPAEEVSALANEAKLFESTDRLARILTVLDNAALEMRNASDVRLVLELAITRLARPETDLTIEALAERITRLEAQITHGVSVAPASALQVEPQPVKEIEQDVQPKQKVEPQPQVVATPKVDSIPQPVSQPEVAVESKPQPTPQPEVVSTPATEPEMQPVPQAETAVAPEPQTSVKSEAKPEPVDVVEDKSAALTPPNRKTPSTDQGDLQRKWHETVKQVTNDKPARGALFQSSRAVQDDGTTLTVAFPKGSTFALKMVDRADTREVVTPIVRNIFGDRIIRYVMDGEEASAAPAAPAPTKADAPVETATSAVKENPAPVATETSMPEQAAAPAIEADQQSGPTVLVERDIEADRREWIESELPQEPADEPAQESTQEPARQAPQQPAEDVQPTPVPAVTNTSASTETNSIEPEDAEAVLTDIFGSVVIKPVE